MSISLSSDLVDERTRDELLLSLKVALTAVLGLTAVFVWSGPGPHIEVLQPDLFRGATIIVISTAIMMQISRYES